MTGLACRSSPNYNSSIVLGYDLTQGSTLASLDIIDPHQSLHAVASMSLETSFIMKALPPAPRYTRHMDSLSL
jgi:hypothetical protein